MDVTAAGNPDTGHYDRWRPANAAAHAAGAGPSPRCGASAGLSAVTLSERAVTLAASQSRSLQFEVMTQEGDRVTLTLASTDTLQLSGYQSASPGALAAGIGAAYSASGGLGYTVEGELSAGESADIQALLGQVSEFAGRFFAGDIEGLLTQVNESGFDMKALASFSLRMDMTRSAQLTSAYRSVQAMTAEGPESAAPSSAGLPAFIGQMGAARSASAEYKDLFDDLLKSAVQLLQAARTPESPVADSTGKGTSAVALLDQLLSVLDASEPKSILIDNA